MYYAYKSNQDLNGVYVVYDLGGGTFDVSIIKALGKNIEVLASEGVATLGGKDFDETLVELVKKKNKAQDGPHLKDYDYSVDKAESDKKSLSKRDECKIHVGTGPSRVELTVTQKEFEDAISHFIAQTEMLCETAMDSIKLDRATIQGVFLAGGSTRIPAIRRSVEKVFQKRPVAIHNPDEVVSLGASIFCAYKTNSANLNPAQKISIQKIELQEIANHFFGTIVLGEELEQIDLVNDTLIPKGTRIPHSISKIYTTVRDDQTQVRCRITQSGHEETDPKFVNIIGEGYLELPHGRPASQEIEVTYSYDDNQIMKCTFLDVATGRTKKIDLNINKNNKGEPEAGFEQFRVD